MIQELLGGTSALLGENKISINGGILQGTPCPSSSSSPTYPTHTVLTTNNTTTAANTSSTTNTSTTSAATTSSNSENQNLRCPRCDSTNTKFCYYNNYNLTQPRHFCKTCRRYWTKGGALRNVPIGGGCRKNRNTGVVSSSIGKPTVGKLKTLPPEFGRSGFPTGFDQDVPSNGILWASPQNSHILALLRAAQAQSPNPSGITSPVNVKDEGVLVKSNFEATGGNGVLNARTLGLDSLSPVGSLGQSSCFWRSDQQQQQNGFTLGEVQNSGLQELYQRLRVSTGYNNNGQSLPTMLCNLGSSSSSSSSSTSILGSAPVGGGGDLSYWNNTAYSWSDLPTSTNGAYP